MTNIFILLGGIVLFVTVIMVLDAIGRRQRRNSASRRAAPGSTNPRT